MPTTTTQTQISNIFNLLTQADSRLNYYHFGWRFNVNTNIENNFNPDNLTGKLYPSVMFDVPDYTQYVEEPDYLGTKEQMQITLYFDNLQDYENDGEQVVLNLIEQWGALKQIAEDFVANFRVVWEYYGAGHVDVNTKFVQRSNLHNDRLITWEVTFMLTHVVPCTDSQFIIDPSTFPLILDPDDLERTISIAPTACARILSQLTNDLLLNCVLPVYDFADVPTQNALNIQQIIDLQAAFCIPCPPPIILPRYSTNFDGVNESISSSYSASHELERTDLFTIDVWIKISSYTFGAIVGKFDFVGVRRGWVLWTLTDGRIVFELSSDASMSNEVATITTSSVPLNTWTRVTVSYSGTSTAAGVLMYLNQVNSAYSIFNDALTTTTIDPSNVVEVGGKAPAYFAGNIYEAMVYKNRVLTPAEITALPVVTDTPIYQSDLVYWNKMGQGSIFGDTVRVYPDYTAVVSGYQSNNMELADLSTDIPV